jgi:hypothetical protein
MKIKKYIPIIAVILFYLMELSFAVQVAQAQNDIAYIILAFTAPAPLFIGMIIAIFKIYKEKENQ